MYCQMKPTDPTILSQVEDQELIRVNVNLVFRGNGMTVTREYYLYTTREPSECGTRQWYGRKDKQFESVGADLCEQLNVAYDQWCMQEKFNKKFNGVNL